MTTNQEFELQSAIHSKRPLVDIVALLRAYKDIGVAQHEVYSFLERMHRDATDETMDDRIMEVADFVAGFCAPHMKVWDGELASPR
jgi:hypothetical protein